MGLTDVIGRVMICVENEDGQYYFETLDSSFGIFMKSTQIPANAKINDVFILSYSSDRPEAEKWFMERTV
jgi:hypothetical protein